jgi:hypothetical protein
MKDSLKVDLGADSEDINDVDIDWLECFGRAFIVAICWLFLVIKNITASLKLQVDCSSELISSKLHLKSSRDIVFFFGGVGSARASFIGHAS